MEYKGYLLCVFLLGIICTTPLQLFAQDSLSQVIEKLELLEAQQSLQVKKIDSLKVKLEANTKSLNVLNSFYETIKDPFKNWLQAGIAVAAILLLLFVLRAIYRSKMFKDWVTKWLREHAEEFEKEARLKKEKRILVLLPKFDSTILKQDKKYLGRFFRHHQFDIDNIEFLEIGEEYEAPKTDFDLVLAYETNYPLDQSIVKKFITEDDKILFIFSLLKQWDLTGRFKQAENRTKEERFLADRINYSNSKATLYSNLIDAMDYHNLISAKLPVSHS